MRSIEVKTVEVPGAGPEGATTLDLIKEIMGGQAPNGWSTPELMLSIRVLAAVDAWIKNGQHYTEIHAEILAEGPPLLLEEADWRHLVRAIDQYRWRFASAALGDFINSVKEAKELGA